MYCSALRVNGEVLSARDVFGCIARLKRPQSEIESICAGPFAAFGVLRSGAPSYIARWRHLIGVGDVRLDHRADVARLANIDCAHSLSDLELVLATIHAIGEACVPTLLGDFAFVVWDPRAQKVLAVRDAFGIKPLYHRTISGLVLFSSEMSPLRSHETYDLEFVVDFITGCTAPGARTVWNEIATVPAASVVRQRGT